MGKEIEALSIKYASKEDKKFIINGINTIYKIEKQRAKKNKVLMKETEKAIKNKTIRVVKNNNQTIGFVRFTFSEKEPYGINYGKRKKFCWLDWMYVSKNYQRKGIGRLLHKDIIKICKRNKIKTIMLDVFEVNEKAKKFYEKEKFDTFIHILKEDL